MKGYGTSGCMICGEVIDVDDMDKAHVCDPRRIHLLRTIAILSERVDSLEARITKLEAAES